MAVFLIARGKKQKERGMVVMKGVRVSTLIEKMNLKNLTPSINTDEAILRHPDINRPALQLTGYYDHFDKERIQIIGFVEQEYLAQIAREERIKRYDALLSKKIPCLIFSRSFVPSQPVLDLATEYGVPILSSAQNTTELMAEIIRWMKVELAPTIRIHGVLVDVYGEGVLIIGESGIGKSEAALELVKRGHRLVSDDAVEIRKVSDVSLVGSAPDITRHFIELRGIGIIDVKTMFGVSSVKDTQAINLVVKLEEWNREKEYDRMGLDDQYTEYMGIRVVCDTIPVRPGRNLAIIVESAAINHRQKKMGYNAAKELYERFQRNMRNGAVDII